MGKTLTKSKRFRVGTTGWSAADLDDPRIEAKWGRGRYEIINGVLTEMPPAYYGGSRSLGRLIMALSPHVLRRKLGEFLIEADIVLDELRVVKGDTCFMTPADAKRQADAAQREGKLDLDRTRVYVPPTIVIESLSPGHRAHDRVTKFGWYAEFGVKNLWMLDAFRRTLDEFVLSLGAHKQVAKLRGRDGVFAPKAFPGVKVPLNLIWPADH